MSRYTVGIVFLMLAAVARPGMAEPPIPVRSVPPVPPNVPPVQANLRGTSPYAAWDDRGMLPAIDREERLAEIHPRQADLINAAYAGYDYRACEHWCAGCPQCIRPHAIPSNTWAYAGYDVGGGAAFFGEGHYPWEGTWGWDYVGRRFRRRVSLGWSHHWYQGGSGAYEPDGPKVLPEHE